MTRDNNLIRSVTGDLNGLVWAACRAALLGKGFFIPGDRVGGPVFTERGSERDELQSLIRPIA